MIKWTRTRWLSVNISLSGEQKQQEIVVTDSRRWPRSPRCWSKSHRRSPHPSGSQQWPDICKYIHTYVHIGIYTYIFIYIYFYAYTCTYICMYIYIFMHIHIYICSVVSTGIRQWPLSNCSKSRRRSPRPARRVREESVRDGEREKGYELRGERAATKVHNWVRPSRVHTTA